MGDVGRREDDAALRWYVHYVLFRSRWFMSAGPESVDPISCLVMNGDAVWVSSGPHIIKFMRGKEVFVFSELRAIF